MSEAGASTPEVAATAKSPSGDAVATTSKAFDLEKQKGARAPAHCACGASSRVRCLLCCTKRVACSALTPRIRTSTATALDSLPNRGKQSPAFKQFFESQLCDDFLCAALDHFAALLRVEDIIHARTAGKKPQDIPPPSSEEKQAAALLDQTIKEVSTYYCYTIMQFSRYKAAQQDRIFFESFYEFTASVVCAAFPSQHRFKIEDELGRIVRTDTFNLTRRKNDSNHHTKMYFTSRELYVLRYAGDGFMGRKILTALHPRRTAGDSVNLTVQKRSTLVSSVLPSPLEIAKQVKKTEGERASERRESASEGEGEKLQRDIATLVAIPVATVGPYGWVAHLSFLSSETET
jgi:hypothetical protein